MKQIAPKSPEWPPVWNPFEVFLLGVSLVSSIGLIQGKSGSALLDTRLNDIAVAMWGAALLIGSALALAGVWCYRRPTRLVTGLYLERSGLLLVGTAAAIYSFVVLYTAADVSGVRFTASVQIAYATACYFRSWQGHRALAVVKAIYRDIQIAQDQGDDDA